MSEQLLQAMVEKLEAIELLLKVTAYKWRIFNFWL